MDEDLALADRLLALVTPEGDLDDDFGAGRIEIVAACERVVAAARALQLEQTRELLRQREQQVEGTTAGLSVIGEVAMARNVSPSAGETMLRAALTLRDMPAVTDALRTGAIGEPTARAIAREVSHLDVDDTQLVDAALAEHLPRLTPRRATELTRELVVAADHEAAELRAESARAEQYVSVHAEADGTATLVAHGPAELVTAAGRALEAWADGARSTGDPRTHGQVQLQTLVERVTGAERPDHADVEIGIVIDAATLLGASNAPAEVVGHGPVAPSVADDIIGRAHRLFYRRLVADPVDGSLVARDPRRRRFDGPLAAHLRARDRHRCRQPGCDCRIRDLDHVTAHVDGGPTTTANGQGLCKRSHTLKHLPGWSTTTRPDGTVEWRTPTGHVYTSPVPALPGRLTHTLVP